MSQTSRPLAVVTGASSGIGLELAKLAAKAGHDLVVASRDAGIQRVAAELRKEGVEVVPVQANLATLAGVDKVRDAVSSMDRRVDLLFANAGRGLGRAFLEQDFNEVRDVIDTNITGTVYLLQRVAREMCARRSGRILVTGSVAGFIPGTFQAVYNGTKAFIDSFTNALRHEIADTGVTVTCLMPGPTATNFFERADMMDTKVGAGAKDDPADVARVGFDAMMAGESSVIFGLKNMAQVAAARVISQDAAAEMHRKQAAPGTASK